MFGIDDDTAGTSPYPQQQPQPQAQRHPIQHHPHHYQQQQQHDQHLQPTTYSGNQGPLHQSMSNPHNSTTTTTMMTASHPPGIPSQSSQPLTGNPSNPFMLPPNATGIAIAHYHHHHHQQQQQQQQQQTHPLTTTATGSYPQAPTMSFSQYSNMMVGSHGMMLAPPTQQYNATKAFHAAPSEGAEAAYGPNPTPTPQHPPQAVQGAAGTAPPSQHLPVGLVSGVPAGAESQDSARASIGVLAAAMATNPSGYSFGQEIQGFYENRRYNPGGMVAAANPTSEGGRDSERGEANPAVASTTPSQEQRLPVSAGPAGWTQAASQARGVEFRGVRAEADFSGAAASGGPAYGEGGVSGMALDANPGAPLGANASGRMTFGGPIGGLPSSFAMGHPHPIGAYQSQGQATSTQDPYFAMMMHHSIQQQQQQKQQQQQQHDVYQNVLAQDYGQPNVPKPMLEAQQRGQERAVRCRKSRDSDSSAYDDEQSDHGDRAPPSGATKAVQSFQGNESVSHGGIPTEAASTARKQEIPWESRVNSQLWPQVQTTSSIPIGVPGMGIGHFPYQHYHPQQQQFLPQQSGLYQSHQLHQGSPYGMVGGHAVALQHMNQPFMSLSAGIAPSVTHVHSSQVLSESRKDEAASESAAPKEKKRRTKSFPEKLLSSMMAHGVNEDAVAWLPDGKSFVVVNADEFVQQILRPTFKECKYASFVRKLHRWGFVRLTSGTGTDCFHHPFFQNGRLDLAAKLNCAPREKDGTIMCVIGGGKPPSLAGVERFIRAKAAAAAAAAAQKASPTSLDRNEGVETADGASAVETGATAVIPSTIEAEDGDVTNTFSSMPAVCRL
jgi:HSF-type DNA-binding